MSTASCVSLGTLQTRSVVGVLRQWVTLQTRGIKQITLNGRSTHRLATEEISLTDGDTSLTVSPEATNMQLQ